MIKNKKKVKEKIIGTALDLFYEHGYHQSSMRSIAEACEMPLGSIYLFFNNKEEIYESIIYPVAGQVDSILRDMKSPFNPEGQVERQKVKALSRSLAPFFSRYYREVLLVLNRSEGGRHERRKDKVVFKLNLYIKERLKELRGQNLYFTDEENCIITVLSLTVIDAVIEIMQNNLNDRTMHLLTEKMLFFLFSGIEDLAK